MSDPNVESCTAFAGPERIASGGLAEVVLQVKARLDAGDEPGILIFDDASARLIDIDFRGSADDVLKRLATRFRADGSKQEAPRGPGRPKLGVVAREVTLLPRHWQWLARQPGGASVALRKLVDAARHANSGKDRVRESQEIAYRFMAAMAGDAPGFEEASRALFAGDAARFETESQAWPQAIRDYARRLAADAFTGGAPSPKR
jgi:hypothetical protein